MDLLEVLRNAEKFGDDVQLKVGEDSFKLGDLRELTKREQQELSRKLAAVDQINEDASRKREEAIKFSKDAQNMLADIEAGKGSSRPAATAATDDLENDPLYRPVWAKLAERDKKIDELTNGIKKIGEQFTNAIGTWYLTEEARNYGTLQWPKGSTKRTREELRKYAIDHQLLDPETRVPSINRAFDEITSAEREALRLKEAEERGEARGREAALAASMGRPTSGMGVNSKKGNGEFNDWGDLEDAVLKDPELRNMINGMQQ